MRCTRWPRPDSRRRCCNRARCLRIPVLLTTPPVTTLTWSDARFEVGVERCYALRTVATTGTLTVESALSPSACVKTKDVFAPAAPKNLAAVASEGAINLIWEANAEADLAGYIVLRGPAVEGGKLVPITPAPIKETTFRDTKVRAGVRYVYVVVAVDTATPQNVSAAVEPGRGDGEVACTRASSVWPPAAGASISSSATARVCAVDGDIFGSWTDGAVRPQGLAGARILAPVVPSKIVAVGLNYKAHAAEQGKPLPAEPLIFIKPSTVGDRTGRRNQDSSRRRACRPRRRGRHRHRPDGVSGARRARERVHPRRHVCERRDGAGDSAARRPVHPAEGIRHLRAGGAVHRDRPGLRRICAVECRVNDQPRQASSTRDLIFPVPELVAFISSIMTLLPGDIISTGTPAGIGPLAPGDTVRVTVGGVGDLVNPVEGESP